MLCISGGGSNDDITRTCLPTADSSGGFSSILLTSIVCSPVLLQEKKNKASVNMSYTYTIHSCLFEASHLLSLNRLTWWPEHSIQEILEVTGRPSSGGQWESDADSFASSGTAASFQMPISRGVVSNPTTCAYSTIVDFIVSSSRMRWDSQWKNENQAVITLYSIIMYTNLYLFWKWLQINSVPYPQSTVFHSIDENK